MFNIKKRVFIASSKESSELASYIGEKLEKIYPDTFECIVWKDGFFSFSETTYSELLKKAISFDYAIIVCGKDDIVIRNNYDHTKAIDKQKMEMKYSARDNVYWEYGLFVGVLSHEKVYCVCAEGSKIASDLEGVGRSVYLLQKNGKFDQNSVDIEGLANKMIEEKEIKSIALLPTTSLAINYYYNFLQPVSIKIKQLTNIEYNNEKYCINEKKINIVLPSELINNFILFASNYNSDNELISININPPEHSNREFTVNSSLKDLQSQKLYIYDVPTILESAFKTITLVMGNSYVGDSIESKIAKYKAIKDFYETVQILIQQDPVCKKYIRFIFDNNEEVK